MIIEATVTYDKIKCSGEQYIVVEPRDMIAGKEWRVFKHCPSKDVAEAVLRIVLIKWKCNEVKL